MATIIVTGILIGVGSVTCIAEEPQALTVARQRYKRDLKPIQARYVRNLEMMKMKYARENDHAAVGVINAEIEAVRAFQNSDKVKQAGASGSDDGVSVSGKCFLYYPPDNKWMKVLYMRPDGKIVGSNHPSEIGWFQKGKVVSMTDGNGKVTGQYRYKKQDDDTLYFENTHRGDVMVIMREPKAD